jgi:hypothetical protein
MPRFLLPFDNREQLFCVSVYREKTGGVKIAADDGICDREL